MLSQATTDAVTTITCLGAAIGGSASDKVASIALDSTMGVRRGSLGEMGIEFAARALVSAIGYNIVASYMPNTADNVAFSTFFFASQPRLVGLASGIGHRLVGEVWRMVPLQPRQIPAKGKACPCGGHDKASCQCGQ